MTNLTPTPKVEPPTPTVWRCVVGAAIAGALATGCYSLTVAIAENFASKPVHTQNVAVLNITIAVRTLVVGMSTLATGVFGLAAFGLMALGVQILFQQLTKPSSPPSE